MSRDHVRFLFDFCCRIRNIKIVLFKHVYRWLRLDKHDDWFHLRYLFTGTRVVRNCSNRNGSFSVYILHFLFTFLYPLDVPNYAKSHGSRWPGLKSRFKRFIANIIGLDGSAVIVVNLPLSSRFDKRIGETFRSRRVGESSGCCACTIVFGSTHRLSIAVRSTPTEGDLIKKKKSSREVLAGELYWPRNIVCARPSHKVAYRVRIELPKLSTGTKTIKPRRNNRNESPK